MNDNNDMSHSRRGFECKFLWHICRRFDFEAAATGAMWERVAMLQSLQCTAMVKKAAFIAASTPLYNIAIHSKWHLIFKNLF